MPKRIERPWQLAKPSQIIDLGTIAELREQVGLIGLLGRNDLCWADEL